MSFLTFWKTTEADVVKVFVALKNAEEVVVKDIKAALGWIAANSATIEADLAKVQEIVTALGLGGDPKVQAALAAATVAAEAFIKFSKAYQSGVSTAQTVAVGYQAYTETKAAVATALAAATSK